MLKTELVNKIFIEKCVNTLRYLLFYSGIHWFVIAALYEKDKNQVELFDSFGRQPTKKKIFIALRNFKYLKYSTKQLQNTFNSTCGVYCLMFVFWRLKNQKNTMETFLNQFSDGLLC